jgi:glycosyltransferase involved in cell wall biosynthesis
MRFAYITHFAPIPSTMANSIAVMRFCNALSIRGITLELIIPSDFKGARKIKNEREIWDFYGLEVTFKISRIPSKKYYKFGVIGRIVFKSLLVFIGIYNKNDLLYFRHVELAILAGLLGKIVVIELHQISDIDNSLSLKLLTRLAKKRKIFFVVITHKGAKKLLRHGVDENKILVAPSAIDNMNFIQNISHTETRMKLQLRNDQKIIVYSGNLYEGRGIEKIIEAMRDFPQLMLVIVGGNQKDIDRCKEIVLNNPHKNILFVGSVLPREVPDYLLAADMLVMPYTTYTSTHKDMSPLKMFEYMASGKPIISSDFPVLREILKDKVNSILVEPDNASAISEGIQWVLDNPKNAKLIAEQARKDVEQYTWDKRAERIVKFLERNLNT